MSVCFFNSLSNREYSNLLISAAFSTSPFSGRTSLPVKNSYLPTFSDDNAEVLADFKDGRRTRWLVTLLAYGNICTFIVTTLSWLCILNYIRGRNMFFVLVCQLQQEK